MSPSVFLSIVCLLLVHSTSAAHVDDNRIIIGSSVGGVLGLVSATFLSDVQVHCRRAD